MSKCSGIHGYGGEQCLIKDFLDGALAYYLDNFPRKLHENEKNGPRREASPAPPLKTTNSQV